MAKKKKPAANPARGFATTSIASKTKVEAPEDTPEPAITASDKANVKEAKPNGTASEGIDHNPVTSERELKDLTPEELEAQLEQSELQQLVELIAPKVKREAARQVSRLETDRRVLRGQAEWLSTSSWFSEETKNRLLQLVASEHEVSDETDTLKGQPLSEDAMLSRIWTLQSILHALEFPEHRVREVIERLLSQPAISEQSTTWGLVEALEWFAVHCKAKELHDYETQKQTESGRSSEEETGWSFVPHYLHQNSVSDRSQQFKHKYKRRQRKSSHRSLRNHGKILPTAVQKALQLRKHTLQTSESATLTATPNPTRCCPST